MASLSIMAGSTSQSITLFIQDSSSTTGAGLSGLTFATANLAAYYTFAGANATAAVINLATLAGVTSAWSSGGFVEVDSVHMKGVYRLDLPNAVLASGKGRSVVVYLYGATNMAPCLTMIELTGWDNQLSAPGGGVTVGAYAGGQDPATQVAGINVSGRTLASAIRYIGAAVSGKSTGAGGGVETYLDFSGVAAFTVTVDAAGNRTAAAYQ